MTKRPGSLPWLLGLGALLALGCSRSEAKPERAPGDSAETVPALKAARKFVEGVGRALEWSRTTPREEVVARMTAIIAKRGRNENAAVLKYWKSYGVAGSHGKLTDRDFQLWIDWMVRDGALKPGQLKPQALYSNELNPFAGKQAGPEAKRD